MSDVSIAHESNGLIAAWATGKKSAPEALRGICELLEARGGLAAIIATKEEGRVIIAPPAHARLDSLPTLRGALGAGRSLRTKSEESFATLCTIEGASWIVCEPLPQKDSSALLVVGLGDAPLDPILVALPDLALACGAICARAELSDEIGVAAHAVNNAMSSVLGNLEFAMSLLSHEPGLLPRLTDETVAELFIAVRHAVRGTRTLHARAQALVKLVR